MKIIIDAENTKKQKTGVGYYTINLIKALINVDKKNKYKIVFWKFRKAREFNPLGKLPKNFSYKKIRFPSFVYFNIFKKIFFLPFSFFSGRADIYFFPNFVVYNTKEKNNIVVIYDLSYIKYPQYCDKQNLAFLTEKVSKTIKNASHIITISKNSKKEIEAYYNISKDKISIISPSYDRGSFYRRSIEETRNILEKYHIVGKYLLFTSTLEPRKNIENIIKAYCLLPQSVKKEYSLVLVGKKGWQDDNISQEINSAIKKGEKIIVTDYVPEEDLPAIYSGATLFLYPSFYEGFGIPILEAMACEVPVITANNSSLPEVGGDAAVYVGASNIIELKDKIVKVISKNSLRLSMIEKGRKQIQKFKWERSAKKLIKIFEETNGK